MNNKRLKLPNGYGSVALRTGRLRHPYIIKVTIDGKQRVIGYAETYAEGLAMLAAYHKEPTMFINSKITFAEVFKLVENNQFKNLADVTVKNYKSAYNHCTALYDQPFNSIRPADMQSVIDEVSRQGSGSTVQHKIKQVLHHCYKYAIKYGIADTDYSTYVDTDKYQKRKQKTPFNTRQLNRIKALIGVHPLSEIAMCVLMLCYSGARPSEFLSVLKADVKLKQRYFIIRDSKTEAGRNRIVPISRKTLAYFEHWMQQPGRTLITDNGAAIPYRKFRKLFAKVMEASRCKHTPHECRHTCATWLDNAGANPISIKRILGHSCKGVTEKVYTHKSIQQLRKAIDML